MKSEARHMKKENQSKNQLCFKATNIADTVTLPEALCSRPEPWHLHDAMAGLWLKPRCRAQDRGKYENKRKITMKATLKELFKMML
jgi:hypothetical protein